MRRFVLAVVLITGVVAVPSSAVLAQSCGSSGGGLSEDGAQVRAHDCSGPTGGSGGPSQFEVVRQVQSAPLVCAGYPDALQETIRWYLIGTNELVGSVTRCVGANVPDPPLPPPPPSALELFRQAPLPAPEVHVSPRVRGLVGLETWLWWGADVDVPPLTVTAGEWSASIEVEAASITWDLGNGDVLTSADPGHGPRRPALTYVYESQCDCTITLSVAWEGVVTLTHPLAPAPIVQAVGPLTVDGTFAYEVEEREAVIVD